MILCGRSLSGDRHAAIITPVHDHPIAHHVVTRERAETALRGMLPRLAVHYSDAPWWKHDLWCLRFDPRIPRRDHEPHGDASVRWDNIAPPWLREGVKFYTYLQMEAGQLTWSTVLQVHVFAARFSEFTRDRGID